MNIQKKLIIAFLFIAAVPVIAGSLFFVKSMQDALFYLQKNTLQTLINTEVDEINRYFQSMYELMDITKERFVVRTDPPILSRLENNPDDSEYVKAKKDLDIQMQNLVGGAGVESILIIRSDGKIIYSTDPRYEKQTLENLFPQQGPHLFEEGKKGVYISDIFFESGDNHVDFCVVAPVFGMDSDFSGEIMFVVNAQTLYTIIQNTEALGETGETVLARRIDGDTQALGYAYNAEGDSLLYLNTLRFDENASFQKTIKIGDNVAVPIQQAVQGNQGIGQYVDYRNKQVLAVWRYIPERHWGLVVKIDKDELYLPTQKALSKLGLGFISIMIFIGLTAWFISRSITLPITELTESANNIGQGNFNISIRKNLLSARDEIGTLANVLMKVAVRLQNYNKDLKMTVEKQTEEIIQKSKHGQDQQKAILNILEDVEKEKKNVERLATDLLKFQLAVENASDHIVITDTEGLVLYANPAVERITGFAPSDIIGKKAGNKDLWGGLMDMPFYQLLWKTIKSDKKVFAGEVNNRRRNGEKYVALASISPVVGKDGSVSYFVGIERDVTKEKEIDRMKTEFISLASHQLRTPLSAMKWFGEMLLHGDAGTLTPDQKEMVDSIYTSNERMIELVNSLLNISRIESGRLQVDPKPTDAGALVQDVVKTLKQKFDEKNQTVVVSVHEHLPLVPLDPKLIREVYTNLITNAIKYTPKGGDIQIFVSKNDTDLVSQVTDNGFGIPKAEQERIFQKFFRAQNIVKMETEGTGLGLYLTKSVVESSGGKIWFTSDEGESLPANRRGTTFFFTIPLSGMTAKKGEVGLEEKKVIQSEQSGTSHTV